MIQEDFDKVVDVMKRNIVTEIDNSKEELRLAYETFLEEGGLAVFLGAKLQKAGQSADKVTVICNISFPKDKYKESLKQVVELRQTELPLDDGTTPETPARTPEDPPGTDSYPMVKMTATKDLEVEVGTIERGTGVFWFSTMTLPKGCENYAGAYESEEEYPDREAATLGGLKHCLGLIDAAIEKKVAPPSKKGAMNKGKKGLEELIQGLESGGPAPAAPAPEATVH